MRTLTKLIVALAICTPALSQPSSPNSTSSPATATPVSVPSATAPPRSTRNTADLGISAADLFRGFTTADGIIKHWSVKQAEVDFHIGGTIRTRYDAEKKLGEPGAIVNTILAYEPDRMLAIKPIAPEGAPDWLKKICQTGWSVLTLEPLAPNRTRLVLTGWGYGEGPEYDQAVKFFEHGNQWTLDQLKKMYPLPDDADASSISPATTSTIAASNHSIDTSLFVASGRVSDDITKETTVNAPPAAVFNAWTTPAGIKSFLGVESNVELRIGGPMELYFGPQKPDSPPGLRGSEGCQILSYLPDRMLSFSWNAPPKLAEARAKRTWVVLTLDPLDDGKKTHVRLVHTGLGEGGPWPEVKTYFDRAWGNVLAALAEHFSVDQ